MVHVTFFFSDSTCIGFDVCGHAKQAEYGQDIVCAAISALCQTTLLGLVHCVHLAPPHQIDDNGEMTLRLPAEMTHRQREDALLLLLTLKEGMMSIQSGYPAYLQVSDQTI